MGSTYNNWSEIFRGIPYGSILGSLLFNIFTSDIFFFIEKSEMCNFTDDNTLYSCDRNLLRIKENRGSEFSSYEIGLQNRDTQNDVTLRVTNSKIFIEIFISSY